MVNLTLIGKKEFDRVCKAGINKYDMLALLADMCRANTLAAVKHAGSGHLGSSFSAMDIVVWLYYHQMNTRSVGIDSPDRDIYFSSKGHDVPGLYSVLFSLGVISTDNFLKLRRMDGLAGHPHVSIPGIEANSGSLGMGISKGKGMAFAKHFHGNKGRVFVMTGDGELQEGQIYEALQTTRHQGITNLHVIVDHNKVQSDKPVSTITDLGNLEAKFKTFGWCTARCNGHNFQELDGILNEFTKVADKPKILIADTIKGRGVSFMEHPAAMKATNGLYRWHSGAPDDDSFTAGYNEIISRINNCLARLKLPPIVLEEVLPQEKKPSGVSNEYVAEAFGEALVEIAAEREDIVVLDADLAVDCHIRNFENKYPERFIENGIAEQDMVSMAGGLALEGMLPVVNTFAAFLASRANEQIYTNACERTKIIYICHYAGLIPAGPGESHQSIRDISVLGALANIEIIEPCNSIETQMALKYCVEQASENCVLRLIIGPSPRIIALPHEYQLKIGHGIMLREGADAVMFAYGPVMLHEALLASEKMAEDGFGLKVVNMPWLNRIDISWLESVISETKAVYVIEDHAPVGGLGDLVLNNILSCGLIKSNTIFRKFAVEGHPACGKPAEVLRYHCLDGVSLANRVADDFDI